MNDYSIGNINRLKEIYPSYDFYFFEEIDSTNNFCKSLALNDFHSPTVVISNTQTKGRGTKGRSWTSPKNKGLWFSILLKPDFSLNFLGIIPLLTSVAVYETLSSLGIETVIKWPNDIFINNKKLCGILTESSILNNHIDYLIVGIGINVNLDTDDFNSELQKTATSLKIAYGEIFNRLDILRLFLDRFSKLYSNLNEDSIDRILKKYKANLCILNKQVSLSYNNTYEIVTPIDIMNDGTLLVKTSDNNIRQICSGEVSLRF